MIMQTTPLKTKMAIEHHQRWQFFLNEISEIHLQMVEIPMVMFVFGV